jgi:hypothetical protein
MVDFRRSGSLSDRRCCGGHFRIIETSRSIREKCSDEGHVKSGTLLWLILNSEIAVISDMKSNLLF